MKRVAIIGGGASGLMAACCAAKNGNEVTVFEKNEKCGKKIYITGKGRCNLTNLCSPNDFLENVVNGKKFLYGSIFNFPPEKTMEFFENGGLHLKVERGQRVFPESDKASDVTRCLENFCLESGVKIKFNQNVLNIERLHSTMFDIITKNERFETDCVIICCGGLSYPSTGSTGDGYKFAEKFGHKIIPPKPSLCGINIAGSYIKLLQGLSLKNVSLSILKGGKVVNSYFGEMLFTHFGISGPIALSASSVITRLDIKNLKLSLDLKPALTDEMLSNRILRDFEESKNKSISNCLKLLLPQALIPVVLTKSKIDPEKKVNSISKAERLTLLTTVKNFDMIIASLRNFDEAIITSGGVCVDEVNPKTMESKKVSGLYFGGEVLDLDALTGGFNLQIAFSTGYAAGNAIKD